jgi:hypothetical protein
LHVVAAFLPTAGVRIWKTPVLQAVTNIPSEMFGIPQTPHTGTNKGRRYHPPPNCRFISEYTLSPPNQRNNPLKHKRDKISNKKFRLEIVLSFLPFSIGLFV